MLDLVKSSRPSLFVCLILFEFLQISTYWNRYAKYVEAEAHDRPLLDLPPAQQTLAKEVIALGKPTVVFLLNGGMVALPDFILEVPIRNMLSDFPCCICTDGVGDYYIELARPNLSTDVHTGNTRGRG